jgi:hypothetical protein
MDSFSARGFNIYPPEFGVKGIFSTLVIGMTIIVLNYILREHNEIIEEM